MNRHKTVVKAARAVCERPQGLALTTPAPPGLKLAQDKCPGRTQPAANLYSLYYPEVNFTLRSDSLDRIIDAIMRIDCPVDIQEVKLYWPPRAHA